MDEKTINKLKEPLDESAIKTRKTDYGEVDYIKSNFAIQQANDIFNYNWTGEIVDLRKISEEEFTKKGKTYYAINFICRYKIIVNGETNEDVGFGSSTQGNKSSATETAVLSAVSDAIKRSLRHYGNQFGLSLYAEHQEVNDKSSSKSSNETIEVTEKAIRNKVKENIKKYGNSKDISDKQHGVLKSFFVDELNIEDENKQHEMLGNLVGERGINSFYDLSYSHIDPVINLIFNKKEQLKKLFNTEEEPDNTFDLISKVKGKLEEKEVENQKFINWIGDKANKDYNTFDSIPENWLKEVVKDSFWDNNEKEIKQFGKSELVKKVKEMINNQTEIEPSQLYYYFGEQDDKEYNSLEEVPNKKLKLATKQSFWDEHYTDISETIPFG